MPKHLVGQIKAYDALVFGDGRKCGLLTELERLAAELDAISKTLTALSERVLHTAAHGKSLGIKPSGTKKAGD